MCRTTQVPLAMEGELNAQLRHEGSRWVTRDTTVVNQICLNAAPEHIAPGLSVAFLDGAHTR